MNIEDIKVVKLKTGDTVVALLNDIDDSRVNLMYPMIIELMMVGNKSAYTMANWLPHQIHKTQDVTIWSNDILFISEPTESFIDYYEEMVDKLEKFIVGTEIMEFMQEEEEIMEAMEEKDLSVIH
jgi:hypothetical protein